mgnify:CR=1 FL=1
MIISRHFCKIKKFLHALGNFFTSFHGFDHGAAEAFFFQDTDSFNSCSGRGTYHIF